MVANITDVFLDLEDFAVQIPRYVGGELGRSILIKAIITLNPAMPDDTRGRGYIHTGQMMVAGSTVVTPADAIKYEGNRYEVVAVGDTERGMKMVEITRYEPETQGLTPLKNSDH